MRTIILLLSFLLMSCSLKAYQIISYNFEIKFDYTQKQILINAIIDLQHENNGDIELLFSSACKISSITTSSKQEIQYTLKGKDTIVLTLNSSDITGANTLINFTYSYPTGEDTLILIDRGHRWYPLIAENIAPFTMNIEVPQNFIAVTTGEVLNVNNKDIKQYTYSSFVPVFKIPLIIAPENLYTVSIAGCGGLKTYVYYISNINEHSIDSMQTDICNLINYFSSISGKYQFTGSA